MISKGGKQVITYFLVALVIFIATMIILDIWELIKQEDLVKKLFRSSLVVFGAVATITFIYSVIVHDNEK